MDSQTTFSLLSAAPIRGLSSICTNSIDGYVCSSFEGFKVSPLNSSHCDKDPNAGAGEQIVLKPIRKECFQQSLTFPLKKLIL